MATSNHGTFDVTKVDTTAYTPLLGTEIVVTDDTHGDRTWIYIKNTTASIMTAGQILMPKPVSLTRGEAVLADDQAFGSSIVLGAVQHAIAVSAGGWILRKGMGEVSVESAGATTYNLTLTIATNAGNALCGTAITHDGFGYTIDNKAGAGAAAITCYIDCRG